MNCFPKLEEIKSWAILIASQWMLLIPGATSYIGCIGKDRFGEEMKRNAQTAGITVS
jgi:sugar/nucleoside kinase (ribokinase family)